MPRPSRRVFATAMLAAAGFTAAILRTIDEFALQSGSLHQGVALSGAAVALGALLGLWYPRRLIRRRLRGNGRPLAGDRNPGVEAIFAALLSAVLMLVLAVVSGLSLLAVGSAENWRAVIVSNILLPPAGALAVVVAPLFASVVLMSGVCTTLVFSLLGWHRAVTWPAVSMMPLWLAVIAAAAAIGAAILAVGSLRLASLVALAAPLAAAFVAALQAPGPQAPAEPPRAPLTLQTLLTPVAAAATSGAACFAVLLASIPAMANGAAGAAIGALLGAAFLAGAAVGRRALTARLAPPPEMAVVSALLAVASAGLANALAWADAPYAAAGVAALTALAGAAALVHSGRMVSSHLGPPQHSVVWVGGSTAAGCLVVAVIAAILARPDPPLGPRPEPALRILASGLHNAVARPVRLDPARASAGAWSIDLAGPRFDVAHVFDPDLAGAGRLPDRQQRRLMLRISRALLPGGRLIVGTSDPSLATLAGRTMMDQPGWRVVMATPRGEQYEAFAFGRDVPDWIALRCGGTEWSAVVEPLP